MAAGAFSRHHIGLSQLIESDAQSAHSVKKAFGPQDQTWNDIMALPTWDEMIADPDLMVQIMETQGFSNVTSITDIEPISDKGSTGHNYKGYINWDDGTQTKVEIKGGKLTEPGASRYREALINHRYNTWWNSLGINTLENFIGVADIDVPHSDLNSTSFEINLWMSGWTDMGDVSAAVFAGEEDTLDLPNFNWNATVSDTAQILAKWHASGWMDQSLLDYDEFFYLKGTQWLHGDGKKWVFYASTQAKRAWNSVTAQMDAGTTDLHCSETTRAVIQNILDKWTWENLIERINSPDNKWGLVHGDFHWGQMMYHDDDAQLLIEDWEFSGVLASPATDLGTLLIVLTPYQIRKEYEDYMLPIYWKQLIDSGVSYDDYPFESLKDDYIHYGLSQAVARIAYSYGFSIQDGLDTIESFVNDYNVDPADVVTPPYNMY